MTTIRAKTCVPLSGVSSPVSLYTFNGLSGPDHFAVRFGEPVGAPLVRVHSECVTGDVFGSLRCDCGTQLHQAIQMLDEQAGWLLYLRQEGRGIGLAAKLDAYVLQDDGMDTFAANIELGFAADGRRYEDVALMLHAVGVSEIRLLTNNREKVEAVRSTGLKVQSVVLCPGLRTPFNASYLDSKEERNSIDCVAHATA